MTRARTTKRTTGRPRRRAAASRATPGHRPGLLGYLRGIGGGLALFAVAFALHIAGGATDQMWLFVLAVVLIAIIAAGFPVLALLLAGRSSRGLLLSGLVVGVVLTGAALWAANDRAMAWWIVPLSPVLVLAVSGALSALVRSLPRLRRLQAARQPPNPL